MKNVILKTAEYKDYGMFSHVYFVDVNYDFNEKNIDEIVEFIEKTPFMDVMIHSNDIIFGLGELLKKISQDKEIWFETNGFLFEDLAYLSDDFYSTLGFDKIDAIIDNIGQPIDFKRSIVYNELVEYKNECPF
jgi:hypothetical protein